MLEEPTITTRVILTEKAPFWVEVFYDTGKLCGTFLVRNCVSEDEIPNRLHANEFEKVNFFDCYIVIEENMGGKKEGLFVEKTDCKRVKI